MQSINLISIILAQKGMYESVSSEVYGHTRLDLQYIHVTLAHHFIQLNPKVKAEFVKLLISYVEVSRQMCKFINFCSRTCSPGCR